MKFLKIITLFLLFISDEIVGNSNDSLMQTYHRASGNKKIDAAIKYAESLTPPDSNKAFILFRNATYQARINKYILGEIRGIHYLGWYYIERLHKSDKAIGLYKKALDLAIHNKENEEIYSIYLHLADAYIFVNQNMEALSILNESRKFAERVNPDKYLPLIDFQLMEHHSYFENYKQAYHYFNEGVAIAKKTNNKHSLWLLYSAMAEIKKQEKKLNEALYYLEEAIPIGVNNKESYAILNLQAKVNVLIQLNRIDEAEKICHRIQKEIAITPAFDFVGSNNISLGLIYLARKDFKKALFYMSDARKEILKTGNNENLLEVEDALSKIYFDMGNYQKSIY